MKLNQILQINIDPFTNLHYSAFYIEGLQSISTGKITYNRTPFENIKSGRKTCLLFILSNKEREFKVAIDFHDPNSVEKEVLEWCDVYAKINYHHVETLIDIESKFPEKKLYEVHTKKLLSIPPSFGIDIFNPLQSFGFISKIVKDRSLSISDKKQIFAGFLRMKIKRHKLSGYTHKIHKKNYIFHLSSIWAKQTEFINISRRNFIRACKSINNIDFEGGLVDIGYPYEYMGDVKDIIFKGGKIKLKQYIKKTNKSYLVFNGSSVEKCHGWKLAEYLSLGKAIISTQLHNDLPFPLLHGHHIHYVDDNYESIKDGIQFLLENPNYVNKLEQGAIEYWNLYTTPQNVTKRIIEFALKNA
jgi:hypothetical protein